MVNLKYWAKSDIGKKRAHNEDTFYANDETKLFMVADGMGGHKGGDKASKLAVKSAVESFLADGIKDIKNALKKAFIHSATEVFNAGNTFLSLKGMGTTLSAIAIDGNIAHIAHIGDSRIYCIRNEEIFLITNDHSLVNEQVEAGIISEEEARVSHLRNIITKAIGHKEIVNPDFSSFNIKKNDIILLCTDGLNNMLSDKEILDIINKNPCSKVVDLLIKEANLRGGLDNITAVLVKIIS